MILPIVMYHGVKPWSEPRSFDALLDVSAGVRPAVEPYLVRFSYLLLDLSEISDEALAQVMRYILEVNEHAGSEALQALLEREIGPETKDIIVTTGQQLIEQGRQQGLEQGREQGIQQGIQALLLRQMRLRFGDEVDAHVEQRIGTASVEQLETWSMRVLSAATLAELFSS